MLDINEYFQKLQEVISKIEKPGVLVLSSYGQDPDTGNHLPPRNWKIDVNQIHKIKEIMETNHEQHRNFYVGLHIMREGLQETQRGGLDDIVGVLGFVADFDDNQAHDYMNRIPHGMTPSYVLETSEGRFQCGFLLDAPLEELDMARKIAIRLKESCKCDHGTADINHVWRIPDTLNYPNQKKVKQQGRMPEPQVVRLIPGKTTRLYKPEEMLDLLPEVEMKPSSAPPAVSTGPVDDEADMAILKNSFRFKNGPEMERLFEGDFSSFESQSEADLSFCNHLTFLYNSNPERIDRIFRQSGLMREKWDSPRRQKDKVTTYGRITIEKAISGHPEYAKKILSSQPPASVVLSGKTELTPAEESNAINDAIEKSKTDPGAAYEPEIIEVLQKVYVRNPADYARYRAKIKEANSENSVVQLDKLVKAADETSQIDTKSDELVELLKSKGEFFHNQDNEAFVSFEQDGHTEVWSLASKGFEEWAGYTFYKTQGKTAGETTLKTAIGSLSGIAKYDGEQHETFLRVAPCKKGYVIDLCNDEWSVVYAFPGGWEVLKVSPVKLWRTETMRELPVPVKTSVCGVDGVLWEHLNISQEDRVLLLALILEAFRPDTPYVIAEFIGGQGTAKSTTQSNVRDLIDPNAVNLRAAPKAVEDIFVSAGYNYVSSYNNLSHISQAMQDAFCTLATGGGHAGRKLYTNYDETVIETKRPVMFNGISSLATQQDLIDRTIRFNLPELSEYKEETELREKFEEAKPGILGGLFELFAKSLEKLPEIKINKPPRMADFARLGEAMAQVLGFAPGEFLALYNKVRQEAIIHALDGSPVALAIQKYLDEHDPLEMVLMKDALALLSIYRTWGEGWPKSPRGLGDALRRNKPGLKAVGIDVIIHSRSNRGVQVTIQRDPLFVLKNHLGNQHAQHTQHTPINGIGVHGVGGVRQIPELINSGKRGIPGNETLHCQSCEHADMSNGFCRYTPLKGLPGFQVPIAQAAKNCPLRNKSEVPAG